MHSMLRIIANKKLPSNCSKNDFHLHKASDCAKIIVIIWPSRMATERAITLLLFASTLMAIAVELGTAQHSRYHSAGSHPDHHLPGPTPPATERCRSARRFDKECGPIIFGAFYLGDMDDEAYNCCEALKSIEEDCMTPSLRELPYKCNYH